MNYYLHRGIHRISNGIINTIRAGLHPTGKSLAKIESHWDGHCPIPKSERTMCITSRSMWVSRTLIEPPFRFQSLTGSKPQILLEFCWSFQARLVGYTARLRTPTGHGHSDIWAFWSCNDKKTLMFFVLSSKKATIQATYMKYRCSIDNSVEMCWLALGEGQFRITSRMDSDSPSTLISHTGSGNLNKAQLKGPLGLYMAFQET